jgi:transposase InsO family protein
MYCGGCIFHDAATKYIHAEFLTALNSHTTLKGKENFEAMCRDHGVVPQSYLTDHGGAFTSADFSRHLAQFQQIVHFAGTGAHHHNGAAERSIQTVMSMARTMMLHAAIHWPEMADPSLWPFAVEYAVYIYNRVPDPSTGLSPHDLFIRT